MSLQGLDGQPLTTRVAPSTANRDVDPAPPARVVTAFVVYQMPNGQWVATEDLAAPVIPSRAPLPDDIIAGAENVKAQVIGRMTATLAAKTTISTQMQMAQALQSQQMSPEEAAMLASMQRRG